MIIFKKAHEEAKKGMKEHMEQERIRQVYKEMLPMHAIIKDVLFADYKALWEYQEKVREDNWFCYSTRTYSFDGYTIMGTFLKFEQREG